MIDLKKITKFVLKSDKTLYAWTQNENFAEDFKLERDMSKFKIKKVEYDDDELASFSYVQRYQMLQKDYLYDGKNSVEVTVTSSESSGLDASCNYIYDTISTVSNNVHTYPLKDEYLKTIKRITVNLKAQGENTHDTLNVNTFKLFMHLYGHTFGSIATDMDNFEERGKYGK